MIEIKLGGDARIQEGIETLNKLSKTIDTNKMKEPAFKMVLTAIGDHAYKNKDGMFLLDA